MFFRYFPRELVLAVIIDSSNLYLEDIIPVPLEPLLSMDLVFNSHANSLGVIPLIIEGM
jgi:hypothetical protein